MRRIVTFLAALVSFGFASCATVWIAPQRAMTEDQWLEYDVSGADAVALARIESIADTITDVAPDGSGIPVRSIRFMVEEWLEGGDGSRAIRAGTSPLDDQPLRGGDLFEAARSKQLVLVLVRKLPDGWVLADGPDPSGAGMRAVKSTEARQLSVRVREIVASQSPESLVARSSAVVVGRCVDTQPCRDRPGLRCGRVVVEETLLGNANDTIQVFAPLVGDLPQGRAVHLLRQTGANEFETIGYQRGGQPITNGELARWHITEVAFRARVEAAARLPRGRGEP